MQLIRYIVHLRENAAKIGHILFRLVIVDIIGHTMLCIEVQDKVEKQIIGEAGLTNEGNISHIQAPPQREVYRTST